MAQQYVTLKQKRDIIIIQLDRFDRYFENIENFNQQNIAQLKLRLSKLEPSYDEFNAIQTQIEMLLHNDGNELPLSEYKVREKYENDFFDIVTKANLAISEFQAIKESVQHVEQIDRVTSEQTQVKLPVITLPTFEGVYTQWIEFRDAFKALVHDNKTISDIQKFYYLKSSLQGEANHLIQSISASAVNYKIAWDLLCERYENKRLIIHNHLKAIFDQQPLVKESHSKLRQLFDNVNRNLRAIESLGLKTESWDTIIIYIISNKFDNVTRRDWESFDTNHDLPTMADMNKFLKNKCDILEQLENNKFESEKKNTPQAFNKHKYKGQYNIYSNTGQINNNTCICCKEPHLIYKCPVFLNLYVNERINKIKRLGACINCLRKNHLVKDCKSGSCVKCNGRHHSLLHLHLVNGNRENHNTETQNIEAENPNTCVVQKSDQDSTNNSGVFHSLAGRNVSQVILSTARVQVYDKWGNVVTCRALLDSASQSTLITADLCKKLGLNKTKAQTTISGINQSRNRIEHKVVLKIGSTHNSFCTKVSALVIPNITEELPSISFDYACLNLPENIELADSNFNIRGQIDILLGANIYWDLLCEGTIQLGRDKPILQLTHLGWIIGGNFNCNETQVNTKVTCFSLETLNKNIERFWETENCVNPNSLLSQSERYCEEHFSQTVERNEQGRFIVSVPYNENLQNLGDSRAIALKRLYAIEYKLSKNLELRKQYNEFMEEYLKLNHMTTICESETESLPTCYLPHHAVIKESSLTTKVRVVFDASAKTTSGLSLNETQLVGPVVQNDLISILISFRWHTFVLTGDVAKMYRQILVKPEQRRLQRILWRFNINHDVECFELNTVTYGTASAPYLATRCLEQLAIEYETTHPQISKVIRKHTYMDDVLTGAESIDELLKLQNDLSFVFLSAGFELRKWQSNVHNLIKKFENASCPTSNIINLSNNQTSKTLGIYWNSTTDAISFSVGKFNNATVTKRVILSEVSQIFDPLGFLAPIIVLATLIIKKLWQLQISWDEQVPRDIEVEWQIFREQASDLIELNIPRHVTEPEAISYELHGFADASEKAFGACMYVRTKIKTRHYVIKPMCAKSRVAPLKNINLPRLELYADQLLPTLSQKVQQSLNVNFERIFYWSNSEITLATLWENYWPIQGRNLCKGIVRNCIKCFKARPKPLQQLMGNLPKVRITSAPPFYNTGVDYAGPILIKDKNTRGYKLIKAYICLFICMATKAVHIEVVTSLDTESFIAVLRRFTARRGFPKNMYSDNGLNFVGANSEIMNLYKFLREQTNVDKISDHCAVHYISWYFIPPRAPNFGGIWEANIKNIKGHLRRIIGNAFLTYEELSTVLTQIEAILNSRPLTPMSDNPDDLDVLTPAHFLVGQRLISVPDPSLQHVTDNKLSRFQYLQKLQQQFWLRWSREYLVELQKRYKWQQAQSNIQIGSLVLLREENLPPLQWPMGRVTAVHPGPDGLTRVVTIKTKNGELKRSVSRLCLLPFEENTNQTDL